MGQEKVMYTQHALRLVRVLRLASVKRQRPHSRLLS